MKRFLLLVLAASCAYAQLQPSRLSAVAGPDGKLRSLYGVPGALSAGPVEAEDVLSVASSGHETLLKTPDAVVSRNGGVWPAPPGPARFAFDTQGRPGAVWFEQSEELCLFRGDELAPVLLPFSGNLLGLALPASDRVAVLLEQDGITRRVVFTPEPFAVWADEIVEPGVLLPDGELFRPEGEECRFDWRPLAPGLLAASGSEGEVRLLDLATRTIHIAPPQAEGPLTLSVVQNGTETPVVSVIDFGQTAPGTGNVLLLRIRNTSAVPVTLQTLRLTGEGFDWVGVVPPLPQEIAAGEFYVMQIRFSPPAVGPYSGRLTVNSGVWDLRGVGDAAAVLQTMSGGAWRDIAPGATLDLGPVPARTATTFPLQLVNRTSALLPTGPVAITGTGARLSGWPGGIVSIASGVAVGFSLIVDTATTGTYQQTLTVGSAAYVVRATITPATLPRPRLTVSSLKSGEQAQIGLRLDAASPVDIEGRIRVQFTPAAGLGPDASIQFLPSGEAAAVFRLTAGSEAVSFSGSATATLQTGSTAGTLLFTVEAGTQVWQESIEIAPVVPVLSSLKPSLGTQEAGIAMTGFDNTRSMAKVQFTFYLVDGTPLTGGTIDVDVREAFSTYFARTPAAAGTFLLQVNFPVSGTASLLDSADVVFVNGVGPSASRRVTFPH